MTAITAPSLQNESTSNNTTNITETTFTEDQHRTDLAIYQSRDEIIHHVHNSPIVIITGQTGCGKVSQNCIKLEREIILDLFSQTTQVPQYILDSCKLRKEKCNIIVSQPRKIAAITIAQRVASERVTELGGEVGYQVGLNRKCDTMSDPNKTKILYCTTGVILERLLHERNMSRYTHIILDEVHERDTNIDFLLIVIRKMLSRDSPNTKIILMSATMNTDQFSEFFKIYLPDNTVYFPPIIDLTEAPRDFEITEFYLEDFEDIWIDGKVDDLVNYEEPGISDGMFDYAFKILIMSFRQLLDAHKTDLTILVFLPGLHEIETFHAKLCSESSSNQFKMLKILPSISVLHSTLSTEDQRHAFIASEDAKIILATNIAESGVTIPNVTYVLDFCLTKYLAIAKGAQISTLVLDWTSKNNCKQRAGRAGRLCPGFVIRMVSKEFYETQMTDYPAPEIQRIGLATVVIKAKMLAMGSPLELLALALDPPDKSSVIDSVLYLKELGGLSRLNPDGSFDYTDGQLTFLGRIMGGLPIDVRLAKLILLGNMFGVFDESVVIAAGLSMKSIFTQSLKHPIYTYIQKLEWANGSGSDCIAILNAYSLWMDLQTTDFKAHTKEELQWCQRHNLDVKNLHEMKLLIQEIRRRLKSNFNIESIEDNQMFLDPREKLFMIKICIAGSFGSANYFVPSANSQDGEREAFKAVDDFDLFRTVYFKNMDRDIVGDVYEDSIREAFERKDIVKSIRDMRVFFDYRKSEKVYVVFERNLRTVESSGEKTVVGKIMPEVFKAVKMRQICGKLPLDVMSREETFDYAVEQGLGKMEEGIFVRNVHVVKNPELCVEPTSAVVKIHGYVTHVEDCNKFFFKPIEALIEHSGIYDDRYRKIIKLIDNMIETADRSPASNLKHELSFGDYVLVATKDGVQRGTFVGHSKVQDQLDINLIDCRKIMKDVDISAVSIMTDKEAEKKLFEIPARVFECTMTEVEPSSILSRDGKMVQEAIETLESLINHKAKIYVYSVVNDVASVTLHAKKINWNQFLIDKGFAQDCEESYLSKMNHEFRHERRISMTTEIWPEQEFERKLDKTQANRVAKPPSDFCDRRINLLGPYSPLEISLKGISRFKSSGVVVDQSSSNSVLLNDDIFKFSEKFCVAAEVSFNMKNRQITIRDTNLMPNIQGLAVLLAMIFCPTAELRRDKQKTRYLSVLTGLGFDENRQQPYYGERDAMLPIDFELQTEDLELINQLRYSMSQVLMTEPGNDLPKLFGTEKQLAFKNIRKLILEIVNKKRSVLEVANEHDAFNWNVDQNENTHRSDPFGNLSVFSFINVPRIRVMPPEMKNDLQKHIIELNQCAAGSLTLHKKKCRLCNFEWENIPELKLHLLSKKHIKRCASLD